MAHYLLVIDQGTTSTRSILYDDQCTPCASASEEIRQHYPRAGWVEHDPDEIWSSVAGTVQQLLQRARVAGSDVRAIAIANQRETVIAWDRATGQPLAPAIVWQDRRTAAFCRERASDERFLFEKTGLILDPYFSATKIRWLLQTVPAVRDASAAGRLALGTVDTWLMWNLTGGKTYATDASNASRTLLLDLATATWSSELCDYFGVPVDALPVVRPSAADFGETRGLGFLPDGIPICAAVGDQQSALFGQGGFHPGDTKCTYGTGAFYLTYLGNEVKLSEHRLLTSVAATTGTQLEYVLEGSVFIAGAAVQWLRENLGLISSSEEIEKLAAGSATQTPPVFVPALVGLGAPRWRPLVQGAFLGLSRDSNAEDLARAILEGVAFQVVDLAGAAEKDLGRSIGFVLADGGMARNAWFLQRQADLLGREVRQSLDAEATARGAAFLAGLHCGIWKSRSQLLDLLPRYQPYQPKWTDEQRAFAMHRWDAAIDAVTRFAELQMQPSSAIRHD